jgi:ribosome-binding factor A
MSRRHSRRRVAPRTGIPADPLFRPPERPPDRKALQLCAQVRDALTWVLVSATGDERLAECTVQAVEPLPGGNRMLVRIGVPPDVAASEVNERLAAAAPTLRIEVAQAITRRKVPELVYLAVPAD